MYMIKTNSLKILIVFAINCALVAEFSTAEPKSEFAKDPTKIVDYSKAEGVELKLSKVRQDYYEINVSAPNTDSADCECPVWSSRPISQMRLFAISLDEPGECSDTILISTEGCGLIFHSGVDLAKWVSEAPEGFKNFTGTIDPSKYYIEGAKISIPDSNGIVHSYTGEFPIYELTGKIDTLDVTFSLQQKCVTGSLIGKAKLFRIRGLTMRLMIDQRKGFPVITKVP